jgi:signal peptidase I
VACLLKANVSAPRSATKHTPSAQAARNGLCWLARFLRNALAVIGLLSVIYHLCFSLSVVISGSMAPTLQGDGGDGSDWMLCERVSYWFRDPRRWEVAEFLTDDHMVVAKRVVGLPGEEIAIRDHRAVVGDAPLHVPSSLEFLRYYPCGSLSGGHASKCGEGYFLLGDDSRDSWDSRFDGPVDRSAIRGRVWLTVWPPSRFGFVNDGRR